MLDTCPAVRIVGGVRINYAESSSRARKTRTNGSMTTYPVLRRPMSLIRIILLCLLLLLSENPIGHFASGQVLAPGYDDDDPTDIFVPRDRRLKASLEQSKRELDDPDGDHREAITTLQRIVEDAEDVFIDSTMSKSVRGLAYDRLERLEGDQRRLYEEMFDPAANAILAGDGHSTTESQREVIRRYFHTSTGADVAFQLAAAQMDRGDLLAAGRLFDRIRTHHRRAGAFEPELSQRCITSLWKGGAGPTAARLLLDASKSQQEFQLAGLDVPDLNSEQSALDWLTSNLGPSGTPRPTAALDWTSPQGTPTRNVNVAPVSTVYDDDWTFPLLRDWDADDPAVIEKLQTLLDSIMLRYDGFESPTLPVLRPIIVGDLIVFPSYGLVKAVHRQTGELSWVALPADETFADSLAPSTGVSRQRISDRMQEFLIQRAWLDATSSQISSDGERVYVVRDSGMVGGSTAHSAAIARWPQAAGAPNSNSLRAYDAQGGNWRWEIGGPRTRTPLPLAGTFFLGPPLAVGGTLYVLGEDLGQVRLLALQPRTGQLEWSVPLANSDTDLQEDLTRRLAGLSPTWSGGQLICPTGTGLVVAVDPLTRSLNWGLRYRDPQEFYGAQVLRRGPFIGIRRTKSEQHSLDELLKRPRWHDSCITSTGNSLLICPPDATDSGEKRRLICVNPEDGTVRWQPPFPDGLFVGAVHDQTVLVVGSRQVDGVDLENGRTLWTLPLATPAGHGVRSGDLYHLPLEGGEIATIDIASGRLLARSPTRSGSNLGNLIAVDGQLFSQSPTEVRAFRPRSMVLEQIAEDLADDPQDTAALAARGELRLHSGDAAGGLSDLREVVTRSEDPRSRQLLVSTLLEGLRSNFATYRPFVDELEQLATTPDLRVKYLMTYARGLVDAGEPALAFRQYVAALAHDVETPPLEHTGNGQIIRRDRLVQGRIAELYAAASNPEQNEWNAYLDEYLAGENGDDSNLAAVRLAAAIPHRRQSLYSSLDAILAMPATSPAQIESRLLTARRTRPAQEQGIIAAHLIEFYARHRCAEPVAQLLNELETDRAHSPCLNQQTGAEWAAAARESADVVATLKLQLDWPTDEILVRDDQRRTNRFAPLRTEGPVDPFVTQFVFLPDNRQISVRDGYGRPRNQVGQYPHAG